MKLCFLFTGHEGWVQALCFSADGYLLVSSADDDTVRIWNVATGECLKSLEGKTESASHCGFHPSGALVASGSATSTVALAGDPSWNTPNTGVPPHVLSGEEILEKEATNLKTKRAQSARVNSTKSDICSNSKSRPKTALTRDDSQNKELALNHTKISVHETVERWLSSSFQRL